MPLKSTERENDILLDEDSEGFINQSKVQQVEDPVIVEIKKEQDVLKDVKGLVHQGWPATVKHDLVPYVKFRTDLGIKKNLLMYRKRLVIPSRLKEQILKKIHDGHCGERRCMKRAMMSVWWPTIR